MRPVQMNPEHRVVSRTTFGRAAKLVGALAFVATAAACGTSASSPTTTSSTVVAKKHAILSVAAVKKLYLADSVPADTAFASFTSDYSSSNNADGGLTVASPAEAKDATKTAKALQKSALLIATLESEAPTKIATDVKSLLVAENVVFQGLLDLAADYSSRSFNFAGWENSFGEAAVSTDQAAAVVAKDLGIAVVPGSTGATGNSG